MRRLLSIAAMTVILAGCIPAAAPPPRASRPMPAPAPAPPPAPVAVPAPAPTASDDWNEWPVTPGDWTYRRDGRGSVAMFGTGFGADGTLMTLRCEAQRHAVRLSVTGAPGGARVTTTSMTRSLHLQPDGEAPGQVGAAIPAGDGLLDAIAFSRGRFVVAPHAGRVLVVPPYAEIGRVIEDCRE